MNRYKFYQDMFDGYLEAEFALFEIGELIVANRATHHKMIDKDYEEAFEAYVKTRTEPSPYVKLVAEVGGNSVNLTSCLESTARAAALEKFPDMIPETHTPLRFKELVNATKNSPVKAFLSYGSDRSKDGNLIFGCTILIEEIEHIAITEDFRSPYTELYEVYLKPKYGDISKYE